MAGVADADPVQGAEHDRLAVGKDDQPTCEEGVVDLLGRLDERVA